MPIKRSELIDPENAGYYQLINRCVRRTFLCGTHLNPFTEEKQNYDHRRDWIEKKILKFAEIFAIEVYSYAVMHNHYHLVVYSDPKAPEKWSDLEVAERWLKVYPNRLDEPNFKLQREMRLQAIVNDPELLVIYRERLGSLSWLMRRINEPVAKQANKEDNVKGHFWEARFYSQALLDEAAALTCMAYVDLNPIRAGIADTLEESDYTGIQTRIKAKPTEAELNSTLKALAGNIRNRTMVLPLKDYIELVEWTAISIVYPDKASMPSNLANTLSHLNIQPNNWIVQIQHYGKQQGYFVGQLEALKQKAKVLKKKWLKGIKPVQELFIPPT